MRKRKMFARGVAGSFLDHGKTKVASSMSG